MYTSTLLDIAMIHSETLIENAIKGDEQAVNRLVKLWYKRIYNFCYKYFTDHDQAMEACQQSFISMYKSMGGLKEVEKFKPWLYRIAINHCHDLDRKEKRYLSISYRSDSEEDEQKVYEVRDDNMDPNMKMQFDEMQKILMNSFNFIAPEQREVLIMKEFEGMKFREIAEVLQISENTAKSRLYYGMNSLKKILEDRNINKDTVYYGK